MIFFLDVHACVWDGGTCAEFPRVARARAHSNGAFLFLLEYINKLVDLVQ